RGSGMVFAVPVVLGTLWAFGLYRPRRDQSLGTEQAAVIRASAAAVAAVVVMLWATRPEGPSGESIKVLGLFVDVGRVQIAVFAAVLPTLLCVHRASLRLVLRHVRRRGRNLRHVAVVGVGRLGQIVTRT